MKSISSTMYSVAKKIFWKETALTPKCVTEQYKLYIFCKQSAENHKNYVVVKCILALHQHCQQKCIIIEIPLP